MEETIDLDDVKIDEATFLIEKKEEKISNYSRRGKIFNVLFVGTGGVICIIGMSPILPATWLQMDVFKLQQYAAPVAVSGFIGKTSLCFFLIIPAFSNIADILNNYLLDPNWWKKKSSSEEKKETWKQIGISVLLYLPGVVPGMMFPLLWEKTFELFKISVNQNPNVSPIFHFLATIFNERGIKLLPEIASGIINLTGTPFILKGTVQTVQMIVKKAKEVHEGSHYEKGTFYAGIGTSLGLLGITWWGMTNYVPLTRQLCKEYLNLSSPESLAFGVPLTLIMGALGFICTAPLGIDGAKLIADIVTGKFKWPSRREAVVNEAGEIFTLGDVVVNVVAGILTLTVVTTAGVSISLQANIAGQSLLTQIITLISAGLLDAKATFFVTQRAGKAIKSGVNYCSSCFFPKEPKAINQNIQDDPFLAEPTNRKAWCTIL